MEKTSFLSDLFKKLGDREVLVYRHGNCDKAENNWDRVLSQKGKKDTFKFAKKIKETGFELTKNSLVIVSPAPRVIQTTKIMFGDKVKFSVYGDLYYFEQFEKTLELYMNSVLDIEKYIQDDEKAISNFLERFENFLEMKEVQNADKIALGAHMVISNFIALLISNDPKIREVNLDESSGFLITKNGVKLITP